MFVGVVNGGVELSKANKNAQDEFWSDNEDLFQPAVILSFDWNSTEEARGFVSPWWPARGQLMGGWGDGLGGEHMLQRGTRHSDMWRSFGSNGRLAYVGITRDVYGSPLANCTVRCFRTATDELVSKVTSDANGYYIATTPYSDGHYLVVHGPIGPELAGASISTILPA